MPVHPVDAIGTRRESPGPSLPFLAAVAALAATALFVRAKAETAEAEHPARGKFVDVDGVPVHYVERGAGMPLVLLHGNGLTLEDFDASGLLAQAAARYRVIALDRPGFGYTRRPRLRAWTPAAQAELVRGVLDRLAVERAIVLGHSWGTLVGVALAERHPERVAGLVLLGGYYYPSARLDVPLLAPPAIPVLGDLMRFTVSPLVGRLLWPLLLRRIFGPAPVPAAFRETYSPWFALRPSQLRAAAGDSATMIPATALLARHHDRLRMPVALVAGAGDRYVDPRQSVRLHHALAGSALDLVDGAGHMVHYAAPERVLAAVDRVAEASRASSTPPITAFAKE